MFLQIFCDPLEQFDVINIFPFMLSYLPTNLNVILFFNLILIAFLSTVSSFDVSIGSNKNDLLFSENKNSYSYNIFFWVFSKIFDLVVDIVEENVIVKKKTFIIIIFFLFLFLLISNMVGMIPFSYTVTSSLILTFFLAFGFFIGINLIGFFHNKSSFFRTFLPGGSPIFIAPLLILIEVVSYSSRIFSLSIRLFANMMSGHALLKILIGFSWNAFISGLFGLFLSLIPWTVVTVVIGLELAIAGLQAYVFTILICIYINDAANPH